MTDNQRSKTINASKSKFAKFVRKIRLEPDTILAFTEGTITHEGLINLGDAIQEIGIGGIVLLVVSDIDKIDTLNEDDMNKIGWFKLPALEKIMASLEDKRKKAEGEKLKYPDSIIEIDNET